MNIDLRSKKIIVILLLLALFCLSIGFAMFSSTLNIKSEATISPDASNFNVSLSSSSTAIEKEEIVPTSATEAVAANSTNAIISEDGKSLSNISVAFTEPGQSVTYKIYVINDGNLKAWLKNYGFYKKTKELRVCTPGEGANEELTSIACEGIKYVVNPHLSRQVLGQGTTFPLSGSGENVMGVGGGSYIDDNSYYEIYITVKYEENAARVDGPFTVQFSDLLFIFRSSAN